MGVLAYQYLGIVDFVEQGYGMIHTQKYLFIFIYTSAPPTSPSPYSLPSLTMDAADVGFPR